ncbi:MAG: cell division protein FtsK [Candidatus Omnitrophica bacterium CG11_big_fil_rev_8_21_14_0_20_42_13]|uniref:Cell division protein FtsK n=1 Tax=Candidatus Ghiorseimicrobium undicola TaxID=1974746 RepID=A0A2H0LWS3_9BACT|nr:MAG: cell division protein FtsK [Candidatus Omnitrophica bacterium CG11_big_fil_rev_8_21_14_0_20_42_13]
MKKNDLLDEILAIAIFAGVILILASLFSYHKEDLPFLTSHPNIPPKNLIRGAGAYLAFGLLSVVGWASYLLALVLAFFGISKMRHRKHFFNSAKIVAFCILIISVSSLLGLIFSAKSFEAGGVIGDRIAHFTRLYFGNVGAYVIMFTFMLLSGLLLGEFLLYPILVGFFDKLNKSSRAFKESFANGFKKLRNIDLGRKPREIKVRQPLKQSKPAMEKKPDMPKPQKQAPVESSHPRLSIINRDKEKVKPKQEIKVIKTEDENYQLPSLDLLEEPPLISKDKTIKEDLTANARILEETLSDFGISVRVTDIERGPAITRYELEPAPGVKVQKIVALSDDIALTMKAQSVRIVAPIPGKSRVGIEVPNVQIGSVYFKEVIQSGEFLKPSSKLMLALGKDTAGKPIVANLGEMPHLLIAGATGSGKTVCVNCLIMSLLYRLAPNELKLLMIDPKMVELACYNGLPHLLSPVVTDAKRVSAALNWVVSEMEERYRILAKEGVRNIESYNSRGADKLPYIIVVVDELADLMAVAQNQIENAITRLAQLSRAVGIHLILATQRPSVDVITGVIKANFPARISFKVASKVDSRTVLDANGADKLLGNGDMLFLKPGQAKLIRIQGGYLKDSEIDRVVSFIKSQSEPVYSEDILRGQDKASGAYGDIEKDELFDDAVRVIMESNQASVSILQRRMRLGYTRAARIIDAMEQEGLVGPYEGSRPRKILVDRNEYLKKNLGIGAEESGE